MALFRKSAANPEGQPAVTGRKKSTVLSHRLLRSLLYLLAWIFLLLVCIGNISDSPVVRETYFMKLDLSHIIPLSVPNALLINSIARSIGLHDFYQVGLWNFCEGYNNEGITHCSKTQTLYWFNPLHILLSELLSGATSMNDPPPSNAHIQEHTKVANTFNLQLLSPQTSPMLSLSPRSRPIGCLASSSPRQSSRSSSSSSLHSPSPRGLLSLSRETQP